MQFQHRPQPSEDSPRRLGGPAPGGGHRAGPSALAATWATGRGILPFRAVNRAGSGAYDSGLQRHHLLPRQLAGTPGLSRLFDRIGCEAIGFDDFRRNGLLLPASEQAARILGLPLHRGPHRAYNRMVIDRVGLIEQSWARESPRRGDAALGTASFRLGLLQQALRRRLLQGGSPGRAGRLVLNLRDPALADTAFAELDAMADSLWSEAETADPGGW